MTLYLSTGSQEVVQRCQMHLIREDLDDALHQVLLSDSITTRHDLLQNSGQNDSLIPKIKIISRLKGAERDNKKTEKEVQKNPTADPY